MIGSTYNPGSWKDIYASSVAFASVGIAQPCQPHTSTNIDLVLTDDIFIRGIEFLASGALFGDTVSLQVIDTAGVTGAPPGTVIATVVSAFNVATDQQKFLAYEAVAPKKALATMTIRAIYTSNSLLVPVNVAINYILLKPLF